MNTISKIQVYRKLVVKKGMEKHRAIPQKHPETDLS